MNLAKITMSYPPTPGGVLQGRYFPFMLEVQQISSGAEFNPTTEVTNNSG